VQCHLNQSRAAECALDEAGSEWSLSVSNRGSRRCYGWNCTEPLACGPKLNVNWAGLRIRAEAWIQADVVARRVETGMIEEVEELRIITQAEPIVDFKNFEDAEVETDLERSAEQIAARVGKAGFREIARGTAVRCRTAGGHTVGTGRIDVDTERTSVEHRIASVYAGCALKLGVFR